MKNAKGWVNRISGISLELFAVCFGVAIRLVAFVANLAIKGLQIDEAMTALNAYSLVDNGTDILGNSYPAYFCTWVRGGQSPFATYLSAISARIFGENLFSIRLPMLILSILGFLAFAKLSKIVFKNSRYCTALICLSAISPWAIFSGAYMLDCNCFGYNLVFASLLLALAIEKNSTLHYVFSMLFFSLSLYSYIAGVFFVPVMLAVAYLILIIKRKISLKNVVVSVLSVLIFSIPFILFGLVSVGALEDFNAFGMFFGGMQDYARSSDVSLTVSGVVENMMKSLAFIIMPELSLSAYGQNAFFYGNILSGIFVFYGLMKITISIVKRNKEFNFIQKLFSVSFAVGVLCFCAFVGDCSFATIYRYGVLSFAFVFFEGVGIVQLGQFLKTVKPFKSVNKKSAFCVYLSASVVISVATFAFVYVPYAKNPIDVIYGDSYIECLEYFDEKDCDTVSFLTEQNDYKERASVFARYHYGNDKFINYKDEYHQMSDGKGVIDIGEGIKTVSLTDDFELQDECYLIMKRELKDIDYSEYNVIDKGELVMLERNDISQ